MSNIVLNLCDSPSLDDLRHAWQQAFAQWLAVSATHTATQRAYRTAWNDLWSVIHNLDSSGDPPLVREFWQVTPAHIQAWIDDMETRSLDPRRIAALTQRGKIRTNGYSSATINQRLAGISSFYAYAENFSVTLPDGTDLSLMLLSHMPSNPLLNIRRCANQGESEQYYLNLAQLRQFFDAIPTDTAQGRRDRALMMFYVMTGARNTQARTLTWKDFEQRDERTFWRWRDVECCNTPDPAEWKELPPECWAAIECYLKAVGRWTTMEADTPIFTAMTMRARNLPGVDPEQWDPYRQPLTAREVNRLVKAYAVRAGLDGTEICTDTLRRSAVVLMEAAGADVDDLRDFLNHRTKHATRVYLENLGGQRDVHARKMAALLRL